MLPWFTKYPNQNDEILNLDWVIKQVENLKAAYEAFLAANSLTFADPIFWDITKQYSKNTIVLSSEGDAYLSKKVVGKGIQLNNTDYWLEIFNFADYVRTANSNLTMHIEQNTTRATAAYAVDDWLLWEDVLYKVTAAIAADDLLTVGTNIVHFTVEDFCRAWQTYMVNTIAQYKADIDASELLYKQQLDGTVLQYKNDIDASELAYKNDLSATITSTTSSLQAQLNAAIAGVTVDSEVINARVTIDNIAYSTLRDAIIAQLDNIYSIFNQSITYTYTGEGGKLVHFNLIKGQIYKLENNTSSLIGLYLRKTSGGTSYYPLGQSIAANSTSYFVMPYDGYCYAGVYANVAGSVTLSSVSTIDDIANMLEMYNILDYGITHFNMFDKDSPAILTNKYVDVSDGSIDPVTGYDTSDWIIVKGMDTIKLSYVFIYAFYDENKTYISGSVNNNHATQDITVSVPNTAKYLLVSYGTNRTDVVQVGSYVDRANYRSFDYAYLFKKLLLTDDQLAGYVNTITVDVNGSGDYTSLTEAIYTLGATKCNVVVKAGTYDIVAEYVALFGQSTVDNLADTTNLSGFQYGIYCNNKNIVFETGAKCVLDWTGHTIDSSHRFSAFAIGHDVTIEGLYLVAANLLYAIHDDYAGTYSQSFVNSYKNCHIEVSVRASNIIGGGCAKYGTYIVDNCYFDNGTDTSVATRYHNSSAANAEPIVIIKNSYFNGKLTMNYYGPQTTKMKCYINNCHAKQIYKIAEPGGEVDNVEIYKWCNDES